jgi:hypothetical protein
MPEKAHGYSVSRQYAWRPNPIPANREIAHHKNHLARHVSPSPVARHRSFNVESPNNTSIMVMIQKRTTTWFSFQPFCSK